jgi:hypothetical protein
MGSGRTTHQLRKFRFERPQKIAAGMLLLLLGQCLWVSARQPLTETDYQYARCGREMWERPSPLAGYFTTCGNIHDGTLAYRAAGLPLTLERIVSGQAATTSTWEMRHEVGAIKLLLRLPFILAGLLLGASLWWVTRRLFGNDGGYISLALYCFSPGVVRASVFPNNEILASLGIFSVIYTAIGVSHALQGPRKKWRPRIVLLTVALGFTLAAHLAAFVVALIFTVIFMAWVAEGRRAYIPTLLIVWVVGAFFLLFASYAFHPDAFSYVFRSAAGRMWVSLDAARVVFWESCERGVYDCAGWSTGVVCGLAAVAVFREHIAVAGWGSADAAGDDGSGVGAVVVGAPVSDCVCGWGVADALETRWRKAFLWALWWWGRLRDLLEAQVGFLVLPSYHRGRFGGAAARMGSRAH